MTDQKKDRHEYVPERQQNPPGLGEQEEMERARRATAKGKLPGTTHDPNSILTDTDMEPSRDHYPPPGLDEDDRR